MSDANTGSAILAGNPADAAAPQSPTAPAAGAAPGGDAAPPQSSWVDAIRDEELRGYVQNKGWKDPVELATGYKNLEKLLGGEKVPLPKGADDADGWSRVYDSLGRPKTADDYKLQAAEGADPAFASAAAGKFHELGLNLNQAQALAGWYSEQAKAAQTAQMEQAARASENDLRALRQDWGQAWDENVELGRRALKEFGVDQAAAQKLEQAMGTRWLLEHFSKLGRGLTEHKFEGGRSTQGFGMTPEAARARIAALRDDPAWANSYMTGNADARAEMTRLMQLAYPN